MFKRSGRDDGPAVSTIKVHELSVFALQSVEDAVSASPVEECEQVPSKSGATKLSLVHPPNQHRKISGYGHNPIENKAPAEHSE